MWWKVSLIAQACSRSQFHVRVNLEIDWRGNGEMDEGVNVSASCCLWLSLFRVSFSVSFALSLSLTLSLSLSLRSFAYSLFLINNSSSLTIRDVYSSFFSGASLLFFYNCNGSPVCKVCSLPNVAHIGRTELHFESFYFLADYVGIVVSFVRY